MSKLSLEIFQSIKTYRCINPTYKATGRKAGESPVYHCLPPCYYHNIITVITVIIGGVRHLH